MDSNTGPLDKQAVVVYLYLRCIMPTGTNIEIQQPRFTFEPLGSAQLRRKSSTCSTRVEEKRIVSNFSLVSIFNENFFRSHFMQIGFSVAS